MIRDRAMIATALVVVAGIGTAFVLDDRWSGQSGTEPVTVGLAKASIRDVTTQPFSQTPDPETPAPISAASADASEAMRGLTLVRPRFQRGGYGAKALLSFTIQNRNDFPVRDVAMRCEFAGADGRFVTSRTRTLPDVVKTKGRKRYGPTLIGFVGTNYALARCAIVDANRADA